MFETVYSLDSLQKLPLILYNSEVRRTPVIKSNGA